MGDLIERQAAIDAIKTSCFLVDAMEKVIKLPSAQPETHEKRTETHACDCISRQAAIDAHYEYCNKHPDAGFPVWSLKILEDLPSAQPEIIHCRNCKYYHDSEGCFFSTAETIEDGFCNWAERKDGSCHEPST